MKKIYLKLINKSVDLFIDTHSNLTKTRIFRFLINLHFFIFIGLFVGCSYLFYISTDVRDLEQATNGVGFNVNDWLIFSLALVGFIFNLLINGLIACSLVYIFVKSRDLYFNSKKYQDLFLKVSQSDLNILTKKQLKKYRKLRLITVHDYKKQKIINKNKKHGQQFDVYH